MCLGSTLHVSKNVHKMQAAVPCRVSGSDAYLEANIIPGGVCVWGGGVGRGVSKYQKAGSRGLYLRSLPSSPRDDPFPWFRYKCLHLGPRGGCSYAAVLLKKQASPLFHTWTWKMPPGFLSHMSHLPFHRPSVSQCRHSPE